MTSQSSAKDVELNLKPIGDEQYVRSGLLGFLGPGGLVFVCGSKDGLMTVTGRKHNADDIIATVLAVEPMRFVEELPQRSLTTSCLLLGSSIAVALPYSPLKSFVTNACVSLPSSVPTAAKKNHSNGCRASSKPSIPSIRSASTA